MISRKHALNEVHESQPSINAHIDLKHFRLIKYARGMNAIIIKQPLLFINVAYTLLININVNCDLIHKFRLI